MTYPYTFACVRGRDRVKSQYQLPAMPDWGPKHIDTLARKMCVALSEHMTGATIIWNILLWPGGNQLLDVRALFIVAGSTDPADGFAVSQLLLLEKRVVVALLKEHPTMRATPVETLPSWAIGLNGDFMDVPQRTRRSTGVRRVEDEEPVVVFAPTLAELDVTMKRRGLRCER